jgi:hypothetical protein
LKDESKEQDPARLNLVERINNKELETFFSPRFPIGYNNVAMNESDRVPFGKTNKLIRSHDNIFNTTFSENVETSKSSPRNAEKTISFIKTSNGGLVSYVPTFKFEVADADSRKQPELNYRDNWPYDNHLKIKLNNPLNQIKRNASSLSSSFS